MRHAIGSSPLHTSSSLRSITRRLCETRGRKSRASLNFSEPSVCLILGKWQKSLIRRCPEKRACCSGLCAKRLYIEDAAEKDDLNEMRPLRIMRRQHDL